MYSRWKIIPEVVGQKGGAHEILNFQFNVRELCLKGNAKLRLVAWAMSLFYIYISRVFELNLIVVTFCPSTGLRNSFIPFLLQLEIPLEEQTRLSLTISSYNKYNVLKYYIHYAPLMMSQKVAPRKEAHMCASKKSCLFCVSSRFYANRQWCVLPVCYLLSNIVGST